MFTPSGVVVDDVDAGSGRGEDLGRGHAARAVRAVEHDVEVARRRRGERCPAARR